jgi:hypothetical protein
MDSIEFSMPKDDYDTVISVDKQSLSVLVGRVIDAYEWSLVCRRKECMSSGRDTNGDYIQTTFTAQDLHCYMMASSRLLSKLLWRKLVDSQSIDESAYVAKYGLYDDFLFRVMEEITESVFIPNGTVDPDMLKCYWE